MVGIFEFIFSIFVTVLASLCRLSGNDERPLRVRNGQKHPYGPFAPWLFVDRGERTDIPVLQTILSGRPRPESPFSHALRFRGRVPGQRRFLPGRESVYRPHHHRGFCSAPCPRNGCSLNSSFTYLSFGHQLILSISSNEVAPSDTLTPSRSRCSQAISGLPKSEIVCTALPLRARHFSARWGALAV